jgi:hypothetical protein
MGVTEYGKRLESNDCYHINAAKSVSQYFSKPDVAFFKSGTHLCMYRYVDLYSVFKAVYGGWGLVRVCD